MNLTWLWEGGHPCDDGFGGNSRDTTTVDNEFLADDWPWGSAGERHDYECTLVHPCSQASALDSYREQQCLYRFAAFCSSALRSCGSTTEEIAVVLTQ